MTFWVALIRGVNVMGRNRLAMKDLAADPSQGERTRDLRGKLLTWLKEHGDSLAAPMLAP